MNTARGLGASVVATLRDRFGGILTKPPRPTKSDFLSGLTSGIASIPDGMASGVIAGINPVYGLYTLMVATPVAALTVSTQLMVVNTTSAMILVAADGLGDLQGDERVGAMIGISLIAGLFQLALGVLGLGTLTKFVSNAVMTGLLTGVAVLIILGQLWDFFGYSGSGDNKIERTADLIANFGEIDVPTTILGLIAFGLMIGLGYTRLGTFNLLIALAVVTAIAWFIDRDSVALVNSLGEISRGLPGFQLPGIQDTLSMVTAGVAVGVVGLLQAAGVAQRYPNPDGKEPDDSQDFMGQGLANIAGSMFQTMPGGGSLSGTALGASAGAQTRWAAFSIAFVVIVAVLVFADLLGMIPMAALAALLIYSSALSIKFPLIRAVQRTTWRSNAAMLLTFLLTLYVPLQQAIILGVVVAGILFIYKASTDIRVIRLQRQDGLLVESPPPATLASGETLLLVVYGSLFYAGARTLSGLLPKVGIARDVVVILRLRGQGDIGSTLLNVLDKYARDLRDGGGVLMLTGVDPKVSRRMIASHQADTIGAEHIFAATHIRHQSMEAAEDAAREWRVTAMQARGALPPTPGDLGAAVPS